MVLSKSERMNREYKRQLARSNCAKYSMDTYNRLYTSFRNFNKHNRVYDQNTYRNWYMTDFKPIFSSYESRVKSSISNYNSFVPYRILKTIHSSVRQQLRDKYRDIDKHDTIKRSFSTQIIGLDNYYTRVC